MLIMILIMDLKMVVPYIYETVQRMQARIINFEIRCDINHVDHEMNKSNGYSFALKSSEALFQASSIFQSK